MISSQRTTRIALLLTAAALCGCEAPPPAAPTDPAPTESPAPQAPAQAQSAPLPEAPRDVPPPPKPQDVFFARVAELCGQAYTGYLTVGTEPSDRSIGEADLTIRIGGCAPDAVDIAFDVGTDRSRTWQLRRIAQGLSLHHDHRDPDGTAHSPTGYGGRTQDGGTDSLQTFPVDAQTVAELPAARGNVWSLEIEPGQLLAYDLQRAADDRFFRVEFDLSQTAATP